MLLAHSEEPHTLSEAKKRLAEVQEFGRQIILILTAQEALKAQRVVREASRRK